jgi:galactokinase
MSLVAEEVIEGLRGQVAADYDEGTGSVAQIYVCRAKDGISKL